MRFMLLVKARQAAGETAKPPNPDWLETMRSYNDRLEQAGVLLASGHLHPASSGIRIGCGAYGDSTDIEEGLRGKAGADVASFALVDVRSKEEAIEWAVRLPDVGRIGVGEIELRRVKEMPDIF
ncbi:YciI family protein [Cohnella caldifontis]|uniref:YciI family protein n=1 Tax=Cohnella caldifontis TaxID=3027471 RepID=UPI0023EB83AA|nr:YciI family protein [Cohnella sp. YIM B05605]